MKRIFLHGALGEEFGHEHLFDVRGPIEAIRLLECNFKGRFIKAIQDCYYSIRCGTRQLIYAEELAMPTAAEEIHFELVVQGNLKGLFGLFLGATGLGAAFAPLGIPLGGAFGGGGAIGLGALGGFGSILKGVLILGVIYLISTALQPKPPGDRDEPNERASFLTDGAVNSSAQGGPVPTVFGFVRVGSVIIHGGISVIDVDIDT